MHFHKRVLSFIYGDKLILLYMLFEVVDVSVALSIAQPASNGIRSKFPVGHLYSLARVDGGFE